MTLTLSVVALTVSTLACWYSRRAALRARQDALRARQALALAEGELAGDGDHGVLTTADVAMMKRAMRAGVADTDFREFYIDEDADTPSHSEGRHPQDDDQ